MITEVYSVPIDDIPKELRSKAMKCHRVGTENIQIISQLKQVANVDFGNAQLFFTVRKLMELEILTPEQFWAMMLEWEVTFNTRLLELKAEIQEQMRRARTERQLWRPGQNGDGPHGS